MADPVKISELPAITSVQPNDIIPIVDSGLTQTSKATAAQICAVGGGPPGDGTVTESKLGNGAVTAAKTGFTAPDKLISRTASGAGTGVEIACTSYARGLLASADSAAALAHLNGLQSSNSPTFTGTITAAAITASGVITANGGINATSALAISSAGVERFRVLADGNFAARVPTGAVSAGDYPAGMHPAFMCRAWVRFSGSTPTVWGSGNVTSVTRVSLGIYLVNFTVPMPDANYVTHHSGAPTVVFTNGFLIHSVTGVAYPNTTYSQSQVAIGCFSPFDSTDRVDSSNSFISVFR
jgi:hypothetical protein